MHDAPRDPARVVLRPVRPGDAVAIRDLLDRLGPVGRYHRYLDPDPDLDAHAAAAAEADGYTTGAVVALAGDEIVGVAEWQRAPRSDLATVHVAVDERWRRRGVATFLVRRLAVNAWSAGIRTTTTTVLASNRAALGLARSLDPFALTATLGVETTIVLRVADLAGAPSLAPVA